MRLRNNSLSARVYYHSQGSAAAPLDSTRPDSTRLPLSWGHPQSGGTVNGPGPFSKRMDLKVAAAGAFSKCLSAAARSKGTKGALAEVGPQVVRGVLLLVLAVSVSSGDRFGRAERTESTRRVSVGKVAWGGMTKGTDDDDICGRATCRMAIRAFVNPSLGRLVIRHESPNGAPVCLSSADFTRRYLRVRVAGWNVPTVRRPAHAAKKEANECPSISHEGVALSLRAAGHS